MLLKAAAAVMAAAAARQQANRALVQHAAASTASGLHQPPQRQHNGSGSDVIATRSVHQQQRQPERPLASSAVDATAPGPAAMSRSFSVESASGIRIKIPVTPVLSTGPKNKPPISNTANSSNNKSANSSHSTLTYR